MQRAIGMLRRVVSGRKSSLRHRQFSSDAAGDWLHQTQLHCLTIVQWFIITAVIARRLQRHYLLRR